MVKTLKKMGWGRIQGSKAIAKIVWEIRSRILVISLFVKRVRVKSIRVKGIGNW